MPSPFPGMDPWLEEPTCFPNLHHDLITTVQRALQAVLPAPYYASGKPRTWSEKKTRYFEPDTNVMRGAAVRRPPRPDSGGGIAVLDETADAPVVIRVDSREVEDDDYNEQYLEIYRGRRPDQRLVTSVEVLSPSNKSPGNKGRRMYLQKRREAMRTDVHLVEIDLLRAGTHTTAVPLEFLRREAPHYDYHVCINRFDRRDEFQAYPIRMADVLPKIRIPLLPEDGVVTISLQSAFNQSYDGGPYQREIDYLTEEVVPPLTPEQAAWARPLIEAWLAQPET